MELFQLMVDDLVQQGDVKALENSLAWLEINPHKVNADERIQIVKDGINKILGD